MSTITNAPPLPAGAEATSEWEGGKRCFTIKCIRGYSIVGEQDVTGRVTAAYVRQTGCDLDAAALREIEEALPTMRDWLEELLASRH